MQFPPNPAPSPGTYQLGLCMAGAVSAGAYTAGALDFLVEALDTWEAERGRAGVPTHRVKLRAMAGASAGGMCAAILAALLHRRFRPARDDKSAQSNPLWQAWVERPDIAALLDPADLRAGAAPLRSLLNVGVLQSIVEEVLDAPGDPVAREWVANGLVVSLSVGNLRGVPFGMAFGGGGSPSHKMRMHADSADFVLGGERPGATPLATPAGSGAGNWPLLGQAALASGAFPFALRARLLSRPGDDYGQREVLVPGDGHPDSHYRDDILTRLRPDWPGGAAPEGYDHLCVDGGVFDNEPLALCRRAMLDRAGQRMVRDGRFADRTVLMVDPFPDALTDGFAEDRPLPDLLGGLVGAWKMQCRFDAVDSLLAGAPDVFSRMMLVPRRSAQDEASGAPLAAGGLSAFLGFFHRDLRAHDFRLGRRNMQRFLQAHFALPAENPLFAGAAIRPDARMARFCKEGYLPLVPLLGACDAREEPLPAWPAGCFDPATLAAPIRARLDALVARGLPDLPGGAVVHTAARLLWWYRRDRVVEDLVGRVSAALDAKGLLRARP